MSRGRRGGSRAAATAVLVAGMAGAGALAAGVPAGALPITNVVEAFGAGTAGQFGNGTTSGSSVAVPTSLGDVAAVAAGDQFGLALRYDGTVVAWGANDRGQLGDGTTTPSSTPVVVSGLSLVKSIAASGSEAVALMRDGTVRAWGANDRGQLGDGTTTDSDVPVTVTNLRNSVRAVRAGSDFTVALLGGGTVDTWGANDRGQLGIGTSTDSDLPVAVSGLSFVTQITTGSAHAAALEASGSAFAWGANTNGQLGIGTTVDADTPLPISSLPPTKGLSAGGNHTLALLSNGTAMAWGANADGEVGDATTTDRPAPVVLAGRFTGVRAVVAGGDFSLLRARALPARLRSSARTNARVGAPLSVQVKARALPNPATLTETGTLPAGVTFTDNGNNTATLSGIPAIGSAGTYPVTIQATNGLGTPAVEHLTVVVRVGPA
ncbi:MAG TPA: putative Ig domain-containing protein [Acidimicrobiales bacterium]|nr:putative Ig domain-containing protein [Acidimicrobiales bacterium]